MNNYRLTFNSSTNITLHIGIFDTIYHDCFYFGFTKRNEANISGFLNELIPELARYQDDLINKLLINNNNNFATTQTIMQNIYKIYLNPFNFSSDAMVNVPFRINQKHYNDFIVIHDVKLNYLNLDFTNYIRTLLVEYATKPTYQREQLFHFSLFNQLLNFIDNYIICKFYTINNAVKEFCPIAIEVSPTSKQCIICGIDADSKTCFIKLSQLKNIVSTNKQKIATSQDCDNLYTALENYYSKDESICLD